MTAPTQPVVPVGDRPLRVLVTRDAAGTEAWADELERRGYEALRFPCLEHREIHAEEAEALRAAVGDADVLAFTSRRGVEAAAPRLGDLPPKLEIAAVGPSTARACRAAFGRCDHVPDAESARGRALAELLAERLAEGPDRGRRVVLCAARDGRRDLDEILPARGLHLERFDVYETVPFETVPSEGAGAGESLPAAGAALLASPSALRGLLHRAGGSLPKDLALVTVGPTTSAAVREAGFEVAAEASEASLEGLLDALSTRAFSTRACSTQA